MQINEITVKLILGWCVAALVPVGLGCLMYLTEGGGLEQAGQDDFVQTVGAFVQAECKTRRKRGNAYSSPHYMRVKYAFSAPAGPSQHASGVPAPAAAQPIQSFMASRDISYRSWAECEAALPAVQEAKAPFPIRYLESDPYVASALQDEPDNSRFLWLGLASIPLAVYGWLLLVLRGRQRQATQGQTAHAGGPEASNPRARDPLRWPLMFVKFTQTAFVKKVCVYLIFALLIGGFVGQGFWTYYAEQAGKERVRAASSQPGR